VKIHKIAIDSRVVATIAGNDQRALVINETLNVGVGDTVVLEGGRLNVRRRVTHVMRNEDLPALADGWVLVSIRPLTNAEKLSESAAA
jgi:hypothetical protein